MTRISRTPGWALFACVMAAGLAAAQDQPDLPDFPVRESALAVDSGLLPRRARSQMGEVRYSTEIKLEGAVWMRLWFGACELSGDPAADGAFIRITSTLDGAVQRLSAEQLKQWSNSSAYFNGESVIVELVSFGGTGNDRLVLTGVTIGLLPSPYVSRSICDGVDDRVLSNQARSGRLLPPGCTAWLINDVNRQFLTAGHCTISATSVMQFNVPLSTSTGVLNNPPPEHQYPVDLTSVQRVNGGIGNDWSYFGTFPNTVNSQTAFQSQQDFFTLATSLPAPMSQPIRVTGYGTVTTPVDRRWNQVQKTHAGPLATIAGTTLRYRPDTTGGNSGSAVFDDTSGLAIGIHTHAGCNTTPTSANQGTAITHPGLQSALANPLGICRSGIGTPGGDLFIAPDLNNNFGTLNINTGRFARIGTIPPGVQGLAFDPASGNMIAITGTGIVFSISPVTGSTTTLGTLTGFTGTLNGLAIDPAGSGAYAIAQASGQLVRFSLATLTVQAIGPARGGVVGALEFGPGGSLYGIDDRVGVGSVLMRINITDGARTDIGAMGSGINDCNGLAADDTALYTVNTSTNQLIRILPTNGFGGPVGSTLGAFGSGFGMAMRTAGSCIDADYNDDGVADIGDVLDLLQAISSGQWTTDPDLNMDGSRDNGDVQDLVDIVAGGGGCP